MIKNASKIEEKIEGRLYQFICDSDSPLGEVYDVICRMRFAVYQKIKEFEENAVSEEKKAECCEKVCEEVKENG